MSFLSPKSLEEKEEALGVSFTEKEKNEITEFDAWLAKDQKKNTANDDDFKAMSEKELDSYIKPLANVLQAACNKNCNTKLIRDPFTATTIPSMGIEKYLVRLKDFFPLDEFHLMYMIYYIALYSKFACPHIYNNFLHITNIHRLLLASAVLAIKQLDDIHQKQVSYAQIGGVKLADLNLIESELCRIIDFKSPPPSWNMLSSLKPILLLLENYSTIVIPIHTTPTFVSLRERAQEKNTSKDRISFTKIADVEMTDAQKTVSALISHNPSTF